MEKTMQELIDYLMLNCTINQADQLELSLSKIIENWNMNELETILNTNKGV